PALGLLSRLMDTAERQGRTGSLIEIRALRALALAATGDHAAATQELAAALTLASPQGHMQVFAGEGPPMAALLGQVAAAHQNGHSFARQVPLSYLAAVLRARDPASPKPAPGRDAAVTVPGLIEPLTSREMQVLELLAAGSPNQQIANDL